MPEDERRPAGPATEELRFDDHDHSEEETNPHYERRRTKLRLKSRALWAPRRGESDSSIPEPPQQETPRVIRHTAEKSIIKVRSATESIVHPHLWQEWFDLRAEIWSLRDVQGLYTASNSKGGVGKTPLTVYLAALRSYVLRSHFVLIIDTNEVTGSTAYRLGIHSEDTILLPEFLANQEMFRDHSMLSGVLDYHPETGLGVMPNRAVIKQRDMALLGKLESGLVVARLAAHDVFCDPGNGIEHWANLVPARMADVLLLPGKAGKDNRESVDRIKMVVDYYREEQELIADRIDKAFVVILGATAKEQEHYAERVDWDPDRVFLIPFDRHMASQAPSNISIERLRLRTKVALAKLLVAMLKEPRNPYINELAVKHQLAEEGKSLFNLNGVREGRLAA